MSKTIPASLTDTRVTRLFEEAKAGNRTVFMPFTTICFPRMGDTERMVPAMIDAGADLIELGIPFSDPIADGPTVQRVSQKALENGATTSIGFDIVHRLRTEKHVEAPLLFMGYYNPILAYGVEEFVKTCSEVGVDGLIIPDLPPEESDELLGYCINQGVHLIYLIAPTSTPDRAQAVLERANGFIYVVALTGVTGARNELQPGLARYVEWVRGYTSLPLAIGFGISTRKHVLAAEQLADGVIFASALFDYLEDVPSDQVPEKAGEFIRMMRGD